MICGGVSDTSGIIDISAVCCKGSGCGHSSGCCASVCEVSSLSCSLRTQLNGSLLLLLLLRDLPSTAGSAARSTGLQTSSCKSSCKGVGSSGCVSTASLSSSRCRLSLISRMLSVRISASHFQTIKVTTHTVTKKTKATTTMIIIVVI